MSWITAVSAVSSPVQARIFLLSPANLAGARAKQALSPNAQFALAVALRSQRGAPLGDLFGGVLILGGAFTS